MKVSFSGLTGEVDRGLVLNLPGNKPKVVHHVYISDITTFEYILALRMGYILFDDAIVDYRIYMSEYGGPSILYKCAEATQEGDVGLDEIYAMIREFPLYGEDISDRRTNPKETDTGIVLLSVFHYGQEYDKCTMQYEDYEQLVSVICIPLEYMHDSGQDFVAKHHVGYTIGVCNPGVSWVTTNKRDYAGGRTMSEGYSGDRRYIEPLDKCRSGLYASLNGHHRHIRVMYGFDSRTERGRIYV